MKSKLIFFFFVILILPATAQALDPVFKDRRGLAIRGYDPVAYFQRGKPVKGKKQITHEWMGAIWRFENIKNQRAFIKNPRSYAPQYGGYCAWAVAQGYTASIDPKAWNIHRGKLYLNFSRSIQRTWEGDKEGHIQNADQNWPRLLQ